MKERLSSEVMSLVELKEFSTKVYSRGRRFSHDLTAGVCAKVYSRGTRFSHDLTEGVCEGN